MSTRKLISIILVIAMFAGNSFSTPALASYSLGEDKGVWTVGTTIPNGHTVALCETDKKLHLYKLAGTWGKGTAQSHVGQKSFAWGSDKGLVTGSDINIYYLGDVAKTHQTTIGSYKAFVDVPSNGALAFNENNNIVADFISNIQGDGVGGAINYAEGAPKQNITGDFIGNSATATYIHHGGAIMNNASIGDITGDFVGNYAHNTSKTGSADSGKAAGGAIENLEKIDSITGDFIGNYSWSDKGRAHGGAIESYNWKAEDKIDTSHECVIGSINGDFIGNFAYTGATPKGTMEDFVLYRAMGGAIWNSEKSQITSIQGNFIGNYVQGPGAAGGAIANGGAVTNGSTALSVIAQDQDINFYGNSAISTGAFAGGGAVMNFGSMSIIAEGGDVTFSGNAVTSNNGIAIGGAIANIIYYDGKSMSTGQLTLTAKNDHTITFMGDSSNSTMDSVENMGIIKIDGDGTGVVNFCNITDNTETVYSQQLTSSSQINIDAGTANIKGTATQNKITLSPTATLSMVSDAQNNISVGTFEATEGSKLDFDVKVDDSEQNMWIDTITTTKATGKISIGSVNLIGSSEDETAWALGTKRTLTLLTATETTSSNLEIMDASPVATATSSGRLYQITAGVDEQSQKILGKIDITKSSYSATLEEIVQNKYKLAQVATYSLDDNLTLTDENGLGTLTRLDGQDKRDFTINGNDHTLTANSTAAEAKNAGVTVNAGDSLTVKNVTIDGFDTFATNSGTMTLDGVKFTGTTVTDIVNDGENAVLNFDGTVSFAKGVTGTGKTYVKVSTDMEEATLQQGGGVNVASNATLTVKADKLQADVTNTGTVALNGGTLASGNTITGGTISIGADVTVASASDLAGDVSNDKTLTLQSGALGGDITGDGTTVIDGTITSEKSIANAVTVNGDANLTNTGTISGSVTNSGTLVVDGGTVEGDVTNNNKINATGSASFTGKITGANGTVTIDSNGNVQMNDDVTQKTLTNKGTLTLSGSEVNVATLTNESTLNLGNTTVKHGMTGTTGKISVDDNHTATIEGAVTQEEIDITGGSKLSLFDATDSSYLLLANEVKVNKVSNSGRLTISKSGTVEFDEVADDNSTGVLDIQKGTVAVSGDLNQAEVAMTSGTNLNLTGTSTLTVDKFTGTGNVTVAKDSTVSGNFAAKGSETNITFTNNSDYQGNLSADTDATLNFINSGTWYPVFDSNNTSTNSATKISLNEGATLNMNDITWDGASIPTRAFRTLNISGDVHSDNSTFMINTDLANSHGDTINFTDTASGTANLQVAYDPFFDKAVEGQRVNGEHTFLTGASGLTVNPMQTAWNQGNGYNLVFTPKVAQVGDKWNLTALLTRSDVVNDETKAVADSAVGLGMAFLQNVNSLQKRMGDLRSGAASNQGWARFQRSNTDLNADTSMNLSGNLYQIGSDFLVEEDRASRSYFGLSLDVFDGSQSLKIGSGDVKSITFSAYYTKIFESGHYFDFIARYGKYDSETSILDTSVLNPKLLKLDYSLNAFSLSGEYGYRFKLGTSGLYIEPQAEVIFGYISGANTTTN